MKEYIKYFNDLAQSQKPFSILEDSETIVLWLPINNSIEIDIEFILSIVRKNLKTFDSKPTDIIGKCFKVVVLASQALLRENIRHTVTVGNVFVNGSPYFKTSVDIIKKEMEMGFIENQPANAHSWITLENGTIIDFTILSSLGKKNKKKPLKWNNAFYTSESKNKQPYKLSYTPYFLGPEYIVKVVTGPNELGFLSSFQWINNIDKMINVHKSTGTGLQRTVI